MTTIQTTNNYLSTAKLNKIIPFCSSRNFCSSLHLRIFSGSSLSICFTGDEDLGASNTMKNKNALQTTHVDEKSANESEHNQNWCNQ